MLFIKFGQFFFADIYSMNVIKHYDIDEICYLAVNINIPDSFTSNKINKSASRCISHTAG